MFLRECFAGERSGLNLEQSCSKLFLLLLPKTRSYSGFLEIIVEEYQPQKIIV